MEPHRLNLDQIFKTDSKDFEKFRNLLGSSAQNSIDFQSENGEFEAFKTEMLNSREYFNQENDLQALNDKIEEAYK
jgi:hypothetical protein